MWLPAVGERYYAFVWTLEIIINCLPLYSFAFGRVALAAPVMKATFHVVADFLKRIMH
jgi:hypothetical protein